MHEIPVDLSRLPILSGDGIHYARMQGLILAAGALQRPQAIASETGYLLASILTALPNSSTLVIDCKHISYIEHHALEPVSRALAAKRSSLLLIDTADISSDLGAIQAPVRTTTETRDFEFTFCGHGLAPSIVEKIFSDCRKREVDEVHRAVKESVAGFPTRRLASTPVKTNVAYNARKILASPPHFIWTTLLLADELRTILQELKSPRTPVVMAVSLRSSPFAVGAALLTSTTCEIIDHMGPTPKILEDQFVLDSRVQQESIYLGDFCIGGTEIRIAQTYALLRGRAMRRGLVIGCLVEEPSAFSGIQLHSLTQLRGICPEATYEL